MERHEEVRPQDIRRIVQERLSGFLVRQAERDAIRAKRRRKAHADDGQEYFPEAGEFRKIVPAKVQEQYRNGDLQVKNPIVFRATFQQPKDVPIKLAAHIDIEVYHSKIGPPAAWNARVPGTRIDFKKITPQGTPHILMKQIDLGFQKQISPWEAFDSRQSPVRLLEAEDYAIDTNGLPAFTPHYLEKLEQEGTEKVQADISKRKEKALEGM
jgi:hypothetical protein